MLFHVFGADDAIQTNRRGRRPLIRRAWYYSVISSNRGWIDLILFSLGGGGVLGGFRNGYFPVAARLL